MVISRVISRITIVITHITGLITPLINTHEPPSNLPQPACIGTLHKKEVPIGFRSGRPEAC